MVTGTLTLLDLIYSLLGQRWRPNPQVRREALAGLAEAAAILKAW